MRSKLPLIYFFLLSAVVFGANIIEPVAGNFFGVPSDKVDLMLSDILDWEGFHAIIKADSGDFPTTALKQTIGEINFNAIKNASSLTQTMRTQILIALNAMKNDTAFYTRNYTAIALSEHTGPYDRYHAFLPNKTTVTYGRPPVIDTGTTGGIPTLKSDLTEAQWELLPRNSAYQSYDKRFLSVSEKTKLKWFHITIMETVLYPGLVYKYRLWQTFVFPVLRHGDYNNTNYAGIDTMLYRIVIFAKTEDINNPDSLKNLPLAVLFHPWGGGFSTMEASGGYCKDGEPFVMLEFALWDSDNPDTTIDGRNTNNWYWGNVYQGRSYPWFHNAVIDVINMIKHDTSIIFNAVKATIDTNRIYASGHSIGGTATNQIAIKHPEIFAAYYAHAGWTVYDGSAGFDGAFENMVGAPEDHILIEGNADQLYLGLTGFDYEAINYTNLGWYFGKTGDDWNYRDPSFPTPYAYFQNGDVDDPPAQGRNLYPALEFSKRGYTYYEHDGGHSGYKRPFMDVCRHFRKDQSFLAFTNRNYDDSRYKNNIEVHGWDHTTIIDSASYYEVTLTGVGTADVTLHRLQKLQHGSGSTYALRLNGIVTDTITTDEYGLITIPQVADNAHIRIDCISCNPTAFSANSGNNTGANTIVMSVMPNPFNASTVITISSQASVVRNQNSKVGIYDVRGKLVLTQSIAQVLPGNGNGSRFIWNAGKQASGIYVVKVNIGNTILMKRVVLLK
ncbi:MAG: hypothetical protein A2487_13605 [Candidatus Raymondbacteria bacterium RifOxyC12_full_50_8]|uniref:Secretion system C-terminal sorting domain-containing protein n=1 Tax=Candidatus Raymondbacteria bacterium RIFOXYD12_FULL_49_13 TaxID=1817890 RepID=A0A1F7F6E3_UNCRA|nr:MAG: hypothetical protein A2350_00870 [Candidatus Raymondbacteria bacterium RifOxyB12_full_50_8]OGK00525.1 MAG: hypothetical protein A2487_13605 [Candidatus Raymondbacteria bacterium RifOxyC12_full_50_8]OGK02163.1 MAG: hypothetical protein A2519_19005 [Candidatus Raymondbacteria bacterium RIFOXYD12_FULL_49_13]